MQSSSVGQIEKKTQARVVALFRDRLHYDYLGDKTELDNLNIEPELLAAWLKKQQVSDTLIGRALHKLHLLERHHNERFMALMKKHIPLWRQYRDMLNQMPLGHEEWD